LHSAAASGENRSANGVADSFAGWRTAFANRHRLARRRRSLARDGDERGAASLAGPVALLSPRSSSLPARFPRYPRESL
jgi:hypothetical protein